MFACQLVWGAKHEIPGALVTAPKAVVLVRDTVTVRLDLNELPLTYQTILNVTEALPKLRLSLDRVTGSNSSWAAATPLPLTANWAWKLNNVETTLSEVKDTLALPGAEARARMNQVESARRYKRGLLNVVGYLQSYMFGTATQDDVAALNERIQALDQHIANSDRVIRAQAKVILEQEELLDSIGVTVDTVIDQVNSLTTSVNTLYAGLTLSELIDSLHTQVTYYAHHFNSLVSDVNSLAHQIVPPTFLQYSELRRVVKYAMRVFDFVPAVPLTHLHNYYSLLDVSVVPGAVLIHVPFRSRDLYRLLNVIPFPSSVTHSSVEKTVILDGVPDFILYDNVTRSIAYPSISDLGQCKTPLEDSMVCPATFVALRSMVAGTCEDAVVNIDGKAVTSKCSFKEVKTDALWLEKVDDTQYVYIPNSSEIIVHCPPTAPQTFSVRGRFHFSTDCTFSGVGRRVLGTTDHFYGALNRSIQPYAEIDTELNQTLLNPERIAHLPPKVEGAMGDMLDAFDFIPDHYTSPVSTISLIVGCVALAFIMVSVILYCRVSRRFRTISYPTPVLDVPELASAIRPHLLPQANRHVETAT